MDFTIRKAEPEDAHSLIDLITALAHYEKLDPPSEDARQRLTEHGWGDHPKFEVWLAEAGGKAVGYTISFETYSTFLARPTLYLEDIFVLPEFRGGGIGYALFKNLAQLAVSRDCGRMEWACLDWNQPSIDFYTKLGANPLGDWRYFRLMPEEIACLP
jgi:GNAT superfamily N-acetyltransferase